MNEVSRVLPNTFHGLDKHLNINAAAEFLHSWTFRQCALAQMELVRTEGGREVRPDQIIIPEFQYLPESNQELYRLLAYEMTMRLTEDRDD